MLTPSNSGNGGRYHLRNRRHHRALCPPDRLLSRPMPAKSIVSTVSPVEFVPAYRRRRSARREGDHREQPPEEKAGVTEKPAASLPPGHAPRAARPNLLGFFTYSHIPAALARMTKVKDLRALDGFGLPSREIRAVRRRPAVRGFTLPLRIGAGHPIPRAVRLASATGNAS